MAYLVKGAPFRYKGAIDVSDCHSSREVMEKAHLAWNVDKCELYAKMPRMLGNFPESDIDSFNFGLNQYREVPKAYGTYRTDCNYPLGLVGEKYEIVQNTEAFAFFDDAIGKNQAIFQTAGYFGRGERIFVSAKLPNNILVNGDPVDNYLVFTNSYDGSSGVKILFTPIRVICQNTLNAAIKTSTNYVSFRHTQSVHDNIDIAHQILGICDVMGRNVGDYYRELAATEMKDAEVDDYLCRVVLSKTEYGKLITNGFTPTQLVNRSYHAANDNEISTQKVNIISAMRDYYEYGIGQERIKGTAWGAFNAVSGYYSNLENNSGIKRMDALLYGSRANILKYAVNNIAA